MLPVIFLLFSVQLNIRKSRCIHFRSKRT